MKLNQILLYAEDIEATKDFYSKLGLEIVLDENDQVQFKLGDTTIQCFDQAKTHFRQDSDRLDKGAGVFLYVLVDDVDAEYTRLVEAGLKPSSKPTDWEWGNREFAIKDPSGYRWVFYRAIEG